MGRHQLFKKKRGALLLLLLLVSKKNVRRKSIKIVSKKKTHKKNVFFFQNFFPNKLSQNESLGSLKISQKIFFLALKEKPLRKKKKKKCRRRRRRGKKEKNKGKKCPLLALCVFTFTPHHPTFPFYYVVYLVSEDTRTLCALSRYDNSTRPRRRRRRHK